MVEILSGLITGILLIVISIVLAKYFTMKLIAATILVAIGFIYVGFSLKDNPLHFIILEIAGGLIFYFMSMIG